MSTRNRRTKVRRRVEFESLEQRLVLSSPELAPSIGPPPPPSSSVIWVNTESALQNALNNLQSGQTIVIQKGTYNLSNTLYVGKNRAVTDVTIRGESGNFNDVVLLGKGMDNAGYGNVPSGISVYNAQNVTIADVSIGRVYYHPIELKGEAGASGVQVYHTRLFDAGQQFLKTTPNPSGGGVNNSSVKYSLIEYTAGTPTTDHGGGLGYTNGIDVHAGQNWVIADNLIRKLHVPDSAGSNLWNPAILIWNRAANVTVERNTIIDCDRAIAMGLIDRSGGYDNQNGIVRNNVVVMTPGLFSASRKAAADGAILAWDSPGTKIHHNTVLTNGNAPNSIQTRWTTGVQIHNNLSDAPPRARENSTFTQTGNYWAATSAMFVNPSAGDFHLVSNGATLANVIDKVSPSSDVPDDWDGRIRPAGSNAEIGADEYQSSTTTAPTVTGVTPLSDATGVAATTSVTATFSQPMQASTILFTLRDGAGNAVPASVSYDDGTRTASLAPASALSPSATYTATVSAGNSAAGVALASPTTSTFTTAAATSSGVTWTQTTAADFNAGTQSGTVVTNNAGGEVQLASGFSDDFNGSALGAAWSTTSWGGSATYTVSGGILSVGGGQILSNATYSGVPVEARLNIGAAPFQHFGLATNLNSASGNSWAIFSTMGTTGTLYARVNANGATTDVNIGALPGGYHDYRVEPVSGGYRFLIDGTVKTTISRVIPSTAPLKLAISSFNGSPSPAVKADWVRVASSPSSGTFTSAVYDAGRTVNWGQVAWTASLPPGTSLVVETISSIDGTGWSSWSAVANGGTVASPAGRYLRYRVRLMTTDPTVTAVFSNLQITTTAGTPTSDTTPPTVTSRTPTQNAIGVGVTTAATATFSEPVQAGTVVFTLKGPSGNTVPATATYNPTSSTVTLSPSAALAGSTTYTATVSGARDAAGNTMTAPVTWAFTTAAAATVPTDQSLLYQSNLQYVGAFRVPSGRNGASTFDYGGTALAFNPANNSLFMVGHTYDQAIAEVAIPGTIVNSTNLSTMSVGTLLQPFTKILPRLPNNPASMSSGGYEAIGGLMVVNGQLIGTAYNTYDASGSVNVSHFKLDSLNLASANVTGLFQVGNRGGGFVGGYMAPVPSEWQSALGAPYLTGQAALNVISRTSYGPAAFGFDPANLGQGVTPVIPYVYYDQNHQTLGGVGSSPPTLFNGTVEGFGIAFVPGTRSVLFFSSIGTGPYYYGEASAANDPNRTSKGNHSVGGNYAFQVWAYDADDFVAVKNGQKNPWDLRPYSTWNFSFPQPDGAKRIGGVAFDPSTGRLYISELNMDSVGNQYASRPLIQVFQVTMNAPGRPSGQTLATSTALASLTAAPPTVTADEAAGGMPDTTADTTLGIAGSITADLSKLTADEAVGGMPDTTTGDEMSTTDRRVSGPVLSQPIRPLAKYSRWYRVKDSFNEPA